MKYSSYCRIPGASKINRKRASQFLFAERLVPEGPAFEGNISSGLSPSGTDCFLLFAKRANRDTVLLTAGLSVIVDKFISYIDVF